jgi:thiol-disulfide isomerase/thioredoxin
MTKLFLAAVAAMVIYSCSPKMGGHIAQTVTDANGNKMLLGLANKTDLLKEPFADWFVKNEAAYTTDAATANLLKPLLADKRFTIFMGTWCGDSKREVPRIYKVLQACGVTKKQITLVMVNNNDSAYKQSPGHEEKGLHIHRVPTLIMWEGTAEKGRMVESPVVSWEKDLFTIANGQPYTPHYAGAEYLQKQFALLGVGGALKDSVRIANELKPLLKTEGELAAYAKMLRTSGQMDRALCTTQFIAMVFAEKADAWYMAGAYQQMAGNGAMAKAYYQKALALQPGHENATKKLAELH